MRPQDRELLLRAVKVKALEWATCPCGHGESSLTLPLQNGSPEDTFSVANLEVALF